MTFIKIISADKNNRRVNLKLIVTLHLSMAQCYDIRTSPSSWSSSCKPSHHTLGSRSMAPPLNVIISLIVLEVETSSYFVVKNALSRPTQWWHYTRSNDLAGRSTALLIYKNRHVSFMRICDCRIFGTLPHFSRILAKCAYRIFFPHKLAYSTALIFFGWY